jgi:hypothetical protein
LEKHLTRILSTGHPQANVEMWTTGVRSIHRLAGLSAEVVDNSSVMGKSRCHLRTGLWINLWITGVKNVEEAVEKTVENPSLWINGELSTIRPQGSATYPQFSPQARWWVFGLSRKDPAGYPHIHSPYYY